MTIDPRIGALAALLATTALAQRTPEDLTPEPEGPFQRNMPAWTAAPIIGDTNGDCVVNVQDLNGVLAGWGGTDPMNDLDGDGTVGPRDRDIVLASWGFTCAVRLTGDIDGNGVVDVRDQVGLLAAWSTDNAQADVDQDGTVGQGDLDLLTANWSRTLGRRLLGDVNGDDVVDVVDLTGVLAAWQRGVPQADVDGDKLVNDRDRDFVLAQWGAKSGTDLPGDVNGDKLVDARDADLVTATWDTAWARADLDGSGLVDIGDLLIVNSNFGATAGRDLLGDVNGDWIVAAVDEAHVLAAWGTDRAQADVDASGLVGVGDLVTVLGAFGEIFGRQLLGDVNGDCVVDATDEALVLAAWGSGFRQADLDQNDAVGVGDLIIVIAEFGQTCP